jgi:hypothetical protein
MQPISDDHSTTLFKLMAFVAKLDRSAQSWQAWRWSLLPPPVWLFLHRDTRAFQYFHPRAPLLFDVHVPALSFSTVSTVHTLGRITLIVLDERAKPSI